MSRSGMSSLVRPVEAAPADMQAHLFPRDAAQRVVERIDPQCCVFAIVGEADPGQAGPAIRQVGVVDLQEEPGIDDRLIFLVHRLGDGEHELLVRFVIFVGDPVLDRPRRIGRQERAGDLDPGQRRL